MGSLTDQNTAGTDELLRQLKIKVGVARRLIKEAASYEKEAAAQEQKIAGMRTEGRDSYDIKKQEEVLQESYMMIPDSKSRLQAALEHLAAFLTQSRDVKEVQESDVYAEANELATQLVTADSSG
ncbi:tubulin-specific chaperone a [Nannochloropsis gaditana]|uniref:Tubulin-specific chaperone A n=1 Tax=Nannochloropsis gaditana TaxID=72520 RepID=W7TDH3_9STRA|nr:tubulin-specific chaperone a [Nannochloropsis gaditana]